MEDYKERFINFLLNSGSLKIGSDFILKSKRISPWFVNVGDFNDGESISELGQFYADSILDSKIDFDLLYGIPEKGNALVVSTAIGLSKRGKNVPWFFTRKFAKEYGETTSTTQEKKIESLVVGRAPKKGQSIVQLDDVFTAGDAKYESRAVLLSLGSFELPLLKIAVDRQEIGIEGKNAIEEYERNSGTKVSSIVNALDIYHFLKEKAPLKTSLGEITKKDVERMANYLRVYGTSEARESIGSLEQKIIGIDRSIIPACDISTLEEFEEIVKDTADVQGIGGYKVGFELGLGHGLKSVVEVARKYTDKPIIYDHQKAGTDIPDTGKNFAEVCKNAGIDAVILFPQAGPETERAWIYHALDKGLNVIVGGRMTHNAYTVNEGGFMADEGIFEIYRLAARAGINNFVVPGNKPDAIEEIKKIVWEEVSNPIFYAPGFVAQGGKISDTGKILGNSFHGIVGRGIYQAIDKKAAAIEYTSQLSKPPI